MSGLLLIPLLAGSLFGAADRPAVACPGNAGARCRGVAAVEVAGPASTSVWKFTRTQGTKDGESFAAITKTADTTQSDPDFAGLIVRCAPKGKVDVLVALIRPFPPRSRPKVTIAASGGGTLTFEASMAAAGAAVLLPDEVSAFAAGKWQTTASLAVVVREGDSEIKGMVALNGLREAYHALLANCGQ
ncbi:hypothetical protein P0R31_06155 [Bradyrhizobium yuanmingense]|uniref:hypothetical protein n=1 Tax=Bradyrhizobium yuanmingense TaxID=108015 RepID=UPI0023B8923A|nr:hypothetical protein [Bradyrhizobium yuanmingense]MDF0516810.1 hypothetical protein [Bradyrhizobium yuanmingense]